MNKRPWWIIPVKLLPLAFYYLLWIIDIGGNGDGFFADILSGLFAGTFSILVEDWGLVAFEIYLLASPKGSHITGGGITVIAVCAVAARWKYMLTEFIFSFAGYWRPTFVIMLAMNGVYILVTAALMWTRSRAGRSS